MTAAVSLGTHDARADETNIQALDEIVVFGRALKQIGSADSASAGLVGYDDLRIAPMLRIGELVETVSGMQATQHSGTGKANQYFLGRFNLDHGTDDEDLEQNKLYLGYVGEVAGVRGKVTLQGYDGSWQATDQVLRRAVESGLIDELGLSTRTSAVTASAIR